MVKPIPNKWESYYERDVLWLRWKAGEIVAYHYEGISLRLGNGAWYTPDWFVVFNDRFECHEVKGHWREAARVRIKVAASTYPYMKFIAFTKEKGRSVDAWVSEVIES